MAKEWAKAFYNSSAWLGCKSSYIAKRMSIDGGLCEECHKEQGYICHHKILLTPANINNPEVALNHDYLKWVCKQCHDNYEDHFTKSKQHIQLKVEFDEFGQPIDRRNL